MKSSIMTLATLMVGLGCLAAVAPAAATPLVEPPSLAERVAAGELPAVGKRLPANPWIVGPADGLDEPGRYGGTLRMLMSGAKDTRTMADLRAELDVRGTEYAKKATKNELMALLYPEDSDATATEE